MKTLCALTVTCALWTPTGAHARDPEHDKVPCTALFEQGVGLLGTERYPQAVQVAKDRNELCPDPAGAYLLGITLANLFDRQIVTDPALREQTRQQSLQHLREAVAGGGEGLRSEWVLRGHQWIRILDGHAPLASNEDYGNFDNEPLASDAAGLLPPNGGAPVSKAPPPAAQPSFPWAPLTLGLLSIGALGTGLATGLSANAARSDERQVAEELRQRIDEFDAAQIDAWVKRLRDNRDTADTLETWTTGLLIGGGVGLTASIVWYVLVPPEGKWSWAISPASVQLSGRF